MRTLRRFWNWLRNADPVIPWTDQEEAALHHIKRLMRDRDGAVRDDVRQQFDDFVEEYENDRSQRQRRRSS